MQNNKKTGGLHVGLGVELGLGWLMGLGIGLGLGVKLSEAYPSRLH